MIFDLRRFIYVEKSRIPYLETIGERVNRILREIKEKRMKIEEAYQELCQMIREVNEIQQRRKELTDRELAIILPLEKAIGKSLPLVDSVKSLIKELEREGRFFQGWNQKTEATKVVGRKIRSFLRKYIRSVEELDRLHDEIMRNLIQVG